MRKWPATHLKHVPHPTGWVYLYACFEGVSDAQTQASNNMAFSRTWGGLSHQRDFDPIHHISPLFGLRGTVNILCFCSGKFLADLALKHQWLSSRFQVPNERLSITDALGRSHRHFGYNPWKSWKWAWDRQGQAIDWIDLANGSKSVNPKPSGWSKITSACASPELQTTPRRFPTLSIKRGKWSRNKPHVRCIRYKSVFGCCLSLRC